MNLPDFRNHNGLNKLRELMRAQYIPDIKKKLPEGITLVRPDEVIVDSDGTLLYKREQVVLYIKNARYYINRYRKYPKYHIVECEKLNLKSIGKNNKYKDIREGVGKPVTGDFILNLSDNPKLEKLETHKLTVCEFCLEKLELKSYNNGKPEFVIEPNEFPLSDWFDAIDDGYEPLPIDRIITYGNYYIAAWRFLSWLCRKNANWQCQQCNIDLGNERYERRFLHAHHTKGKRYNRPEDLIALCIGCHAEQFGENHLKLKSYDEYSEFMTKYGDIWRELILQKDRIRDNQIQTLNMDDQDPIPF